MHARRTREWNREWLERKRWNELTNENECAVHTQARLEQRWRCIVRIRALTQHSCCQRSCAKMIRIFCPKNFHISSPFICVYAKHQFRLQSPCCSFELQNVVELVASSTLNTHESCEPLPTAVSQTNALTHPNRAHNTCIRAQHETENQFSCTSTTRWLRLYCTCTGNRANQRRRTMHQSSSQTGHLCRNITFTVFTNSTEHSH